jgi:AcrR family transcriptional regulator
VARRSVSQTTGGRRTRFDPTRFTTVKRDGNERWELLVGAAVQLFHDKGYTATSIQDLADAAGITKGSVYHYIETKEDLLYEIVRRAIELRASNFVEPPEVAGAAPETRLRAFIDRWMSTSSHASTMSVVAELELRWLTARRLRAVIAQRDKFSAFVKDIITDGIASGAFDKSVDPTLATNTIFVVLRNIPSWYRPGGPKTFDEIVAWNADFLLSGLRGRPS